jgi:predicted transcriptional regulator
MPDEAQSVAVDRELVTKIVAGYVRRNPIGADQIDALISTVHDALADVGKPAQLPDERTPAVPIRRSIQRDQVICLECGWSGKVLRRHISAHEITVDQYRQRWGLSPDHALVAPGYSDHRSAFAKQIGLGRRRNGTSAEEPAVVAAHETPLKQPRSRRSTRGRSSRAETPVSASAEE